MLRDRRSMMVMFGLPLVLYPLLTLAIAGLGANRQKDLSQEPARIVLQNAAQAPQLAQQLRADAKLFTLVNAEDPRPQLNQGKIDAVVHIPPDFEKNLLASAPAEIKIEVDHSHSKAAFAQKKITQALQQYQQWVITQRLAEHHVPNPTQLLQGVTYSYQDVATGQQRLGKILSLMLPMLLLMTGMLGALFPALNATTTERELGTLETLLVTPASRTELLLAKGLLVLISGLLTSFLNMASMSLVLWRTLSLIAPADTNFMLSPAALALSYLAAVPTILCFTTIVLTVGLLARNFREANSFATPIMLLPLGAIFISLAEPPTSTGLLMTPVLSTAVIIRDVLTDRATWWAFALAFASSSVYAGLMLSLATRLFTNEQLVNPSWEPVSLKGFGRKGGLRRYPTIDEAIALFAVTVLLMLYVSPSLAHWPVVAQVAATGTFLLAAPALLLGYIGRYRWKETFSLRLPNLRELVGAILLGFGVIPLAQLLAGLQDMFWPRDPKQHEAMLEPLLTGVAQKPFLTPLLIGLFAGVCEELLFRGPLQSAFLRKTPQWFALAFVAALFALAHLDIHGMPARFFLGLLLGWMVYHTGSIIPAILTHWVIDSAQLFYISHLMTNQGEAAVRKEALSSGITFSSGYLTLLAIAVALFAGGLALLYFARKPAGTTAVRA